MKAIRVFGVELELHGSMEQDYNDGSGRTYALRNVPHAERHRVKNVRLPPGWKFVPDGSCGIEFVSPPIIDTDVVAKFIRYLHDCRIPQNTDFLQTGLHVHVGAMDLEPAEVMNVARFCRYFDRALYSFFDSQRRKNQYCRPLTMNDARLKTMVDNPNDVNRYLGCNINAMSRHGTIEFRYSEGHLDIEKIEAMVDLFTRIVEFGRHGQRLTCKPNTAAKRAYLLDFIGARQETKSLLLRCKLPEPMGAPEVAID